MAGGEGVQGLGPGGQSSRGIGLSMVPHSWGTLQERSHSRRVQGGGCPPLGRPGSGIGGLPSYGVGCIRGTWGGRVHLWATCPNWQQFSHWENLLAGTMGVTFRGLEKRRIEEPMALTSWGLTDIATEVASFP